MYPKKNRRLSSKSHEPPYFIGYFLSLHAAFTAPLATIQSNLPWQRHISLRFYKEIWNTDLNNIAIAGIEEARSKEDKHCDRLGYAPSYRYINAGVLLINLDYWRKYNIEEKCRQYYAKNIDRMLYNDQDLLNALLYDKKL